MAWARHVLQKSPDHEVGAYKINACPPCVGTPKLPVLVIVGENIKIDYTQVRNNKFKALNNEN